MKKTLICGLAGLFLPLSASHAVTIVSRAVEDINHLGSNAQNRNEMILNNTGGNTGRFAAIRFDSTILSALAYTDSGQYTLDSITLTITEQAGRDGSNGTLSGQVGAYFMNTAENSDWTVTSAASLDNSNASGIGTGWFGNSLARPGNVGGGATGSNNADNRSNGAANPLASFWDGTSFVNHTFVSGTSDETAVIDLTLGGASLLEIQSILADWVAGNNAGLGLGGEFGAQSFWQSNSVDGGVSVGSTIDGNSASSGVSSDDGLTANGPGAGSPFLTLEFTAVPEPSTALLAGLGLIGLLRRRR